MHTPRPSRRPRLFVVEPEHEDLQRLFFAELARASRRLPPLKNIGLRFSEDAGHCVGAGCALSPNRAFGYFDEAESLVALAPKLAQQERDRQLGVIRHEIGHAADLLTREGPRLVRHLVTEGGLPRTPEARADVLAELLFDAPVRYDEEAVQTVGPGGPRPHWLPA